jgi:hypothetical protein
MNCESRKLDYPSIFSISKPVHADRHDSLFHQICTRSRRQLLVNPPNHEPFTRTVLPQHFQLRFKKNKSSLFCGCQSQFRPSRIITSASMLAVVHGVIHRPVLFVSFLYTDQWRYLGVQHCCRAVSHRSLAGSLGGLLAACCSDRRDDLSQSVCCWGCRRLLLHYQYQWKYQLLHPTMDVGVVEPFAEPAVLHRRCQQRLCHKVHMNTCPHARD